MAAGDHGGTGGTEGAHSCGTNESGRSTWHRRRPPKCESSCSRHAGSTQACPQSPQLSQALGCKTHLVAGAQLANEPPNVRPPHFPAPRRHHQLKVVATRLHVWRQFPNGLR